MKVIVNTSGFYAGTWHEAGPKITDMVDAVAKPFLPLYGDQISLPKAERMVPVVDKKAG